MAKQYAVVFTYSFDEDAAVYLFDTFEEATGFLEGAYNEELRIERDENGWDPDGFITELKTYARISTPGTGGVDDVCEYHLANVYA